jgi:hypothetical protein
MVLNKRLYTFYGEVPQEIECHGNPGNTVRRIDHSQHPGQTLLVT